MSGQRGRHRLSARRIETAKAGMHADGAGLYLNVKPKGARSWIYRYMVRSRRRDMGLGAWPAISLARARELADQARAMAKEGRDPLVERPRPFRLTFQAAAELLIEVKAPGWQTAKRADQWRATLAKHTNPRIGELDVAAIDTTAVLGVLGPIWLKTPEAASKVRQRIEAVLGYASAVGARQGDNPARWRGHLDQLLPAPRKVRAVEHFAAMDWRQLPEFWQLLTEREGVSALALQFAILTAARSGEVRGAWWAEIDTEATLWTIPGTRITAGQAKRVPLSGPALAILDRVRGLTQELVFPGQRRGKPLSDMSLTAVLRRMAKSGHIGAPCTVHGFRSAFRDWCNDTTNHRREVADHALAQELPDRFGAAHARSDLFDKRRNLMSDWAFFVIGK